MVLYLKGYTGAVYSDNRWRQIKDDDGQFEKERDQLAADGLSVDNWHPVLRNQIGDSRPQGNDKLWSRENSLFRNLLLDMEIISFPTSPPLLFSLRWADGEHRPGIQYETEYFPFLCTELKNGGGQQLSSCGQRILGEFSGEPGAAGKFCEEILYQCCLRKYLGLWISIKLFKFPE